MTVTMTRNTGTRVARSPWPAPLALHLLPAAAAFALILPLRALDLSPQLAFALVLIPIQLGLLRAVPALRRRLPLRLYFMLLPSLAAIALGVTMLLDPLTDAVVASAGPLAVPHLVVFVVVTQLLLTAVTVRLDSVRVSIAANCLIGCAIVLLSAGG